jgi:hypothetical protein
MPSSLDLFRSISGRRDGAVPHDRVGPRIKSAGDRKRRWATGRSRSRQEEGAGDGKRRWAIVQGAVQDDAKAEKLTAGNSSQIGPFDA